MLVSLEVGIDRPSPALGQFSGQTDKHAHTDCLTRCKLLSATTTEHSESRVERLSASGKSWGSFLGESSQVLNRMSGCIS